ncbi:MAG: cyclodeaminase/cyclohydrolase family protein [Pseudomonadota bacterium]
MLMEMTVNEFLRLLSSDAPAPGGGSAAALNGALAAALLTKVCRLSIGRKELDGYEDELLSVLEEAEKLRNELTGLVDRDTKTFNQVMDAYKMPKITDQEKTARDTAIQDASRIATEVPLEVARHCCLLLKLTVNISQKSNSNTASDLGVSAQCSYGATLGGLMNAEINIPTIKDGAYASKIIDETKQIREKAESLKSEMDSVIAHSIFSDN